MSKLFRFGGLFHKASETHEEDSAAEDLAAQATRERLAREAAASGETADDLDVLFREALADGEVTGDIIAVDERGRAVKGRKRSNIFDA